MIPDLHAWVAIWCFATSGTTFVVLSVAQLFKDRADSHRAEAEKLEQERLLIIAQAQVPRPVGFRPTPRA